VRSFSFALDRLFLWIGFISTIMSAAPPSLALYKVDPRLVHVLNSASRHHPRILPFASSPTADLPMHNFVQQTNERSTLDFVRNAQLRKSTFKDTLASVLQSFGGYSKTDANALVDRGRMFVFGPEHLTKLFRGSLPQGRLLLDVGAGDGNVTSYVASNFERVFATEASLPMLSRLKSRGYVAVGEPDCLDNGTLGRGAFDLVMMLNVLDRAAKPLSMLKSLKQLVKADTGRILLAVVLPWCELY
jgi:SAM-dependent methyltransferase